jgi:hypothetical protein
MANQDGSLEAIHLVDASTDLSGKADAVDKVGPRPRAQGQEKMTALISCGLSFESSMERKFSIAAPNEKQGRVRT